MVNLDPLIHEKKYFEVEYIKSRQAQYNFTQLLKVETFLWDLELYGQLQRLLGKQVVLKGGAAAQLYVAAEKQRTSVDIDVVYLGDDPTLANALDKIHKTFGNDDIYLNFQKFIPKNPKTTLPLTTYTVTVPTVSGGSRPINIKIDFHLMNKLSLKIMEIQKASAFVIPLAFNPVCLTPESLVGDKLLTLAQGSVGIPPDREADIPKQLYDLDNLSRIVQENEIEALFGSIDFTLQHELSARNEKSSLSSALEQVTQLLERYSVLGTSLADKHAQKAIYSFRSNYEPRPPKNLIEWGIVCKRLQFLVRSILAKQENPLTQLGEVDLIERAIATMDEKNVGRRPKILETLRNELTDVLKTQQGVKAAKQLQTTKLERLLWEIVTPASVKEIQKRVSSIIAAS